MCAAEKVMINKQVCKLEWVMMTVHVYVWDGYDK